ncbi:hypothetical protein ACFO26_04650 [Lactococcus nasutitermitis]|uniref:Uncharacterized protein n=1 Tax=Lactococcus nasutitermitis TaxID=1652957 RepID=A0ABV9JFC1_9LACT|nr:hypothetical protein [Lactococcus nasutitermitis]
MLAGLALIGGAAAYVGKKIKNTFGEQTTYADDEVYNLNTRDGLGAGYGNEPTPAEEGQYDGNGQEAKTSKAKGGGSSEKVDVETGADSGKYPHGKYVDAPYHTNTKNSIKSERPRNGQESLNDSLSVSGDTTNRRISVANNQFVVLDETEKGEYHGHVRTWRELNQKMQAILRKAGLVTKKGKIIG